jgi:hypothetical protein
MNNLVYFPKLDLDLEKLKTIALTSGTVAGMSFQHRRVENFEYMQNVMNEFPFLSSVFSIYKTYSDFPIHIDSNRKCTLNIPVANTENSETICYDDTTCAKSEFSQKNLWHTFENLEHFREIYRFTLDKPTLFNTTIPHKVIVSKVPRVSISWGIVNLDFEQAREMFESMSMR